VVQTAEGRSVPKTDDDRSNSFRSLLAYSGKFRTEGDKIIIKVDIAWDEAWNGTEQVRFYRIEGNKLHIEAAAQPYPNWGGKVMRGILTWVREE
jgi:Lipocalin-like domain